MMAGALSCREGRGATEGGARRGDVGSTRYVSDPQPGSRALDEIDAALIFPFGATSLPRRGGFLVGRSSPL
jgi:hypothetical protein